MAPRSERIEHPPLAVGARVDVRAGVKKDGRTAGVCSCSARRSSVLSNRQNAPKEYCCIFSAAVAVQLPQTFTPISCVFRELIKRSPRSSLADGTSNADLRDVILLRPRAQILESRAVLDGHNFLNALSNYPAPIPEHQQRRRIRRGSLG